MTDKRADPPPPADPSGFVPADKTGEWFTRPDIQTGEPGLRFACTMCGNCCSGPDGFVLVSPAEIDALAARFALTGERFIAEYTTMTSAGRSLIERDTPQGKDCIFLDRTSIPGKAICGVYDLRPKQCRTWPFWPSVVASEDRWRLASRICPGMGSGKLHPPQQIRIQRDSFAI